MRKNYRKRKFNRKRKNTYKIFFLILVGMTVGFATINTTLQLIGTLNISKTTWNIHWDNPTKTGGVAATTEVKLKDGDNTTVEYQVDLKNPGDYYEFTVDAKNEGTIDAMITGISNKVYENSVEVTKPDYLDFTVTYADDKVIANNHLLAAGKSESYKVKVVYKPGLTADQLPTTTRNLKFTFQVTYMQADENATTVGNEAYFATDSWDDIIRAYKRGKTTQLQQDMEAGTTREVQLDLDNDGTAERTAHLRIVNLSTPAECNTPGFSQSACGFVIEFSDIIASHRMNPYDNSGNSIGDGNNGGWKYSDMRAFLNNGKYLEGKTGEIDYTSTGIYSALPSDLKSKIIDTEVVSGHGSKDNENFTTTDKLYLLSAHEVWEKAGTSDDSAWNITRQDSAWNLTRQLDYYKSKGVTTENPTGAEKRSGGTSTLWWIRSSWSGDAERFHLAYMYGAWASITSNKTHSVFPAFRIG